MNKEITTTEAAPYAKVSKETIRNWIRDFGIGHKCGGRWMVNVIELEKVMRGIYHYDTQGRPRGKAAPKGKTKG